MRYQLRFFGFLGLLVGVLLLVISISQNLFWGAFVALPLIVVSLGLLRAGYLRFFAQFVAGETADIIRDNLRKPGENRDVASYGDPACRNCSHCGALSPADARFCSHCGRSLQT
ncbi:MAG: zinc-ribbon domain-containing protein [Candidatus Hydrogenedentes bacterium]|nr:zinc-ribbon domain-containing protein [Candidatus Hydrogenedentota bacterium]